jgi:predicted anti-sigma-YlaC factor YlaD
MTDHDEIRELLALSAAGLLEAHEERRLREHVAECAACRTELEDFAELAGGLATLPCAPPPPYLLARTQALVAADCDRREGARLATAAAVIAAVLIFGPAAVLRILFGDAIALAWLAWTLVLSILGCAAALALASRRHLQRSSQ